MIIEMQEDIRARGMDWDKYMESIKKTKEQLRADLAPNAEKRVQGALILRALTKELAISVGDTEIDAELTKQREAYKDNKTALANISTKEYRRYLGISLTNRLVMDKLLSTLVT
jgi:FKBP-type peptidyl-prolyl cis-trans isomerase (trigger factor)